jgi:hypothetical protein
LMAQLLEPGCLNTSDTREPEPLRRDVCERRMPGRSLADDLLGEDNTCS